MSKSELLALVMILVIPVGLVACNSTPVSTHLATIDGKATSIERSAADAQGHVEQITGAANEPHKEAISKDLSAIVIDAKGIRFVGKEAVAADGKKDKELKRYTSNPLVGIAMFVWNWGKVFIALGAVTLAAYPVALVLGCFNPASTAYRISQVLVRALPLANPVRWCTPQTATVPAVTVPVVQPPVVPAPAAPATIVEAS